MLNHGVEGQETDDDRWPDDVRQVIRQNYQIKEEFTCNDANFVYEPKTTSVAGMQRELRNSTSTAIRDGTDHRLP